jgi:hypothetical protein
MCVEVRDDEQLLSLTEVPARMLWVLTGARKDIQEHRLDMLYMRNTKESLRRRGDGLQKPLLRRAPHVELHEISHKHLRKVRGEL